jgi:nucleoside diphosphate kinase
VLGDRAETTTETGPGGRDGGGEVPERLQGPASVADRATAAARILQQAYDDRRAAASALAALPSSPFGHRVRTAVEETIAAADALEVPAGWAFAPGGKPTPPNLMQRVVACRVRDDRRLGNWSGTGAGKTVSALLASRVIDARTTLILCPNAVVDGWVRAIADVFPGSGIAVKNLRQRTLAEHTYIVANYEHLQRPEAPAELEALAAAGVDMVVIDEIHQAKQRDPHTQSLRRENLGRFLATAAVRNPNLRVLGMSATPVINNLAEGVSLVDLVTGAASGVGTDPTISNCMALHQQLVRHGIRWMPAYDLDLNYQEIPVPLDDDTVAALLDLPRTAGPLAVEQVLTAARLSTILAAVGPKTLLYTHYKQGIVDQLTAALEAGGWSVGHYTGDDKTGLAGFVSGDTDVLIGTSSIGTGVDGLQHVCSRAIVNVLPWTDADYTQLKGRIFRQGQRAQAVDFIVPVTHAVVDGREWSWCRMKLDRLTYKRSVADAAVEGTIPEQFQLSPDQAAVHSLAWLARLAGGA